MQTSQLKYTVPLVHISAAAMLTHRSVRAVVKCIVPNILFTLLQDNASVRRNDDAEALRAFFELFFTDKR